MNFTHAWFLMNVGLIPSTAGDLWLLLEKMAASTSCSENSSSRSISSRLFAFKPGSIVVSRWLELLGGFSKPWKYFIHASFTSLGWLHSLPFSSIILSGKDVCSPSPKFLIKFQNALGFRFWSSSSLSLRIRLNLRLLLRTNLLNCFCLLR